MGQAARNQTAGDSRRTRPVKRQFLERTAGYDAKFGCTGSGCAILTSPDALSPSANGTDL